MADEATKQEVVESFESVNGISVNQQGTPTHDLLVKVDDEEAVGKFFQLTRELDVTRSSTTRKHLPHTVLDSWIDLL